MKIKVFVYIFLLLVSKQTIALSENLDISIYTGTFDVIDKEGDDQTSMIGIEHRNTDLLLVKTHYIFTPVLKDSIILAL